jgi:cell division septation protein DedD
VIGGLIGENKSKTRSGVPYLMDIPVFGRFFGTTLDNTERTELIMLITPNVIRGRDDARLVTEDFKSKVNAVRNELERLERDRAKSPPKVPPAELAPPVEPKTSKGRPSFAPSRGTPSTGASLDARFGHVVVLASPAPSAPASVAPPKAAAAADLAGERVAEAGAGEQVADVAPAQAPAYLLSVTRAVNAPPAAQPKPEPRAKARWTVQVAASAERPLADAMAASLRAGGYDAYVVTAEALGKIWHRVRVGRFFDLGSADHVKNALRASKFKHAYVAVN